MPVQVRLPVGAIRLDPGGESTCEVAVANTGETADRFTFEVLGAACSWTTVDPPALALAAGASGMLRVHLHPPRAAHVRAGPTPFGLLALSHRNGSCAVAEELLVLGRFAEVFAELIPRVHEGRSASFQLSVRNAGNSTLHLALAGRDPHGALAISCSPPALTVFPGTTATSRIRVRSRRLRWRGAPRPQRFEVIARPEGDDPITVAATLLERALLTAHRYR